MRKAASQRSNLELADYGNDRMNRAQPLAAELVRTQAITAPYPLHTSFLFLPFAINR